MHAEDFHTKLLSVLHQIHPSGQKSSTTMLIKIPEKCITYVFLSSIIIFVIKTNRCQTSMGCDYLHIRQPALKSPYISALASRISLWG
jgi:hypothetical protein